MKKVELIKGLSYRGRGVSAILGTPLLVNDNKADELVSTGFFKTVGISEPTTYDNEDNSKDKEFSAEEIEAMKKDELISLAIERNINIEDCKNNEERIDRIKGALGLANMNDIFDDEE